MYLMHQFHRLQLMQAMQMMQRIHLKPAFQVQRLLRAVVASKGLNSKGIFGQAESCSLLSSVASSSVQQTLLKALHPVEKLSILYILKSLGPFCPCPIKLGYFVKHEPMVKFDLLWASKSQIFEAIFHLKMSFH